MQLWYRVPDVTTCARRKIDDDCEGLIVFQLLYPALLVLVKTQTKDKGADDGQSADGWQAGGAHGGIVLHSVRWQGAMRRDMHAILPPDTRAMLDAHVLLLPPQVPRGTQPSQLRRF